MMRDEAIWSDLDLTSEEEDGEAANGKVDEASSLVGDKAAEVHASDALPSCPVWPVKLLQDDGGDD